MKPKMKIVGVNKVENMSNIEIKEDTIIRKFSVFRGNVHNSE